ncbi:MAG: hypothetical protein AAF456_01080 [Planctomycetota bacterium]
MISILRTIETAGGSGVTSEFPALSVAGSLPALSASGSLPVNALVLLVVLAAPFLVFTIIVHLLERTIQRRLAERFGWRSVLWTGWLGTPVHELSHALMCVLFRHKIDELALFEPDRRTGRLGYVKHSFRRGNWFQELGNVFIGMAPLAGGSIALALLLWMFYPDAAGAAIESGKGEESATGLAAAFDLMTGSALAVCSEILNWQNLFTLRFWVFMYLVLCVGGHMAPSASDYAGASRGVFLLLVIVVIVVLILALVQTDVSLMIANLISAMSPLFALFVLTILLCCIATAIVFLLTSFLPQRYRVA